MRFLVLALAFVATQALAQYEWVEGSIFGLRTGNTKKPSAIFVNSYTGHGPAAGQWVTVDLTEHGIPIDTKGVFLSGLLIISHGSTGGTCDLTLALRAPGDKLDYGNYIGQVIDVWAAGGQRSTFATWVPVIEGKFEYQWNRNTWGQWPKECAYGINLSLQAYMR
jgi:hypothetical protein